MERSDIHKNIKPKNTTVLIATAKTGDMDAVGELHEKFEKLVKNLVIARGHILSLQNFNVEGISQEVWKTLANSITSFSGESYPEFYGWMDSIVKSSVVKQIEHDHAQKRDPGPGKLIPIGTDPNVLDSRQPSPSSNLKTQERKWILNRALDELPEQQKAAIRLRIDNDNSYEEIAEILGTTQKAVHGLISRGLKKLRELPELKDLIME